MNSAQDPHVFDLSVFVNYEIHQHTALNSLFHRFGTSSFDEVRLDLTNWGRQVESAVGAHLANRSIIDGFDLLYWRTPEKKEVDYVLRKGDKLIAIEVKSGAAKGTSGMEIFKKRYADSICEAMVVGPEGLPLDIFFQLNIPEIFRYTKLATL